MFTQTIDSIEELRTLYRTPLEVVQAKVRSQLDAPARTYIEAAPFVLLGTVSPDGTGDVSPKGGPAGFVVVLDDSHLAIPDLAGNNLLDTITNVVAGSGIGLIFMVPGIDETLRVNGQACLTTDPTVLDACAIRDKRPKAAIGVTVTQQYMHCAKAFRRSELWNPDTWPGRAAIPTLGCIIKGQMSETGDITAAQIDDLLEADYAATMWEVGGV